jgi:hypothetical protein
MSHRLCIAILGLKRAGKPILSDVIVKRLNISFNKKTHRNNFTEAPILRPEALGPNSFSTGACGPGATGATGPAGAGAAGAAGGQAPLEPPGAGKKWMETMETLPKNFQNEGITMFHLLCGFDDLILWFSHQKVW